MNEKFSIYTPTMARVLEKQGKNLEALQIYRYLVSTNPERADLVSARDRLEARLKSTHQNELIHLLEEWIDLLLAQKRMCTLKRLDDKKPSR